LSVIKELQRRNVFRVALGYIVSCWLLVQVADIVLDNIGAPEWVMQTILLVLALGLPVVLFFSWAFEVTPGGIKRESEIDRSQSITHVTGRKLDRAITFVLVVALAYFAFDKFVVDPARDAEMVESAKQSLPAPQGPVAVEASIAVLPFVNMSNDLDQEYFSDGISEELLNALVRVDGLDVASRTSAFAYKGTNLSIPEIAAELGVTYVLEGSVRKAGDQLRITAQLIDTGKDRHLWSESYDRTLADIFAIQSEIASAITSALKNTLGITEKVTVDFPVLTHDMSAYDLYLKGRDAFTYRAKAADVINSARYLEQSLALDPDFVAAMESLAGTYSVLPEWTELSDEESQEYYNRAMALTDRVLEIDPERSLAWTVRGGLYGNQWANADYRKKWEEALNRALELDPRNVLVHHWRGMVEIDLGFLDRAREEQERCLELEPKYANCMDHLMDVLTMLEKNDEAMDLLALRLENTAAGIYYNQVLAAYMAGNRAAALALIRQIPGGESAPVREILATLDGTVQDPQRTLQILEEWAAESGQNLESFPEFLVLLGAEPGRKSSIYGWYWYPVLSEFRKSDTFKQLLTVNGIVDVWREKGFPPQCRPLGDDDFECD